MEAKSMNIYQKLAAITAALKTVKKNLEVKAGAGTYKAVAEADVLKAVKPLEENYGVYSYPAARRVVAQDMVEMKTGNGPRTNFFLRIETDYRFVNADKPEEYIEITTYGDGLDSGDKAPGKAMTYGDKYALLKAYKIATGDDPDSEPSGEYAKRGSATTQAKTQPKQQTASKTTCKSKYTALTEILKSVDGWDLGRVKEWIISKTGKDLRVNDLSDDQFNELTAVIVGGGSNE